jgi:hypothetical protein
MKTTTQTPAAREAAAERKAGYHEPLPIKHEQLRDITGQKYGEKPGVEKEAVES